MGARALARTALRGEVARRTFFDRTLDFWLGELSPTWSLDGDRARVVAVRDEARDVKTFVLRPGAAWTGHLAGQYVPVDVEIAGKRVRRCYSIASAPGQRLVSITVKRVPGGVVSSFLHDHVGEGAIVHLGAAAGDFTTDTTEPLLLVAGGSGITPVMSILRERAARNAVGDVVLLSCARSADDVIFGAELASLAAAHPGLRVIHRLDDLAPAGGLDDVELATLVPDVSERETFLCGPAGMMAQVERTWASLGLDPAKLHLERFTAARAPMSDAPPKAAKVHLSMAGRSVEVDGDGTLLEQLERAGERPAHGCRMGICGSCRCHKTKGTVVDVVTGEVSSEPDQEIKLCTSQLRSDVELSL
jgi:ferredoxin-NADP reductase